MMSMVPPLGWGDVATRRDVSSEFAAVRGEMHAELTRQTRLFVTWLVTSQSVVIAVVGLLLALAR